MLSNPFLLENSQFDIPYSGLPSFSPLYQVHTSPHQDGNRDPKGNNDKERPNRKAENSIHSPTMRLLGFHCHVLPGLKFFTTQGK
jgi:hypothetical protein